MIKGLKFFIMINRFSSSMLLQSNEVYRIEELYYQHIIRDFSRGGGRQRGHFAPSENGIMYILA